MQKYKNIKSYIKNNGGVSDARNYGIKKLKENILFLLMVMTMLMKQCTKNV